MKKIFLVSLLALLWNNLIHAQGIPQAVNYQAIARDAKGKEIINQKVSVRLSIFAQSPSGTMEWQELHESTTSPFGVYTLQIGKGKSTTAGNKKSFSEIDWLRIPQYLKVETDNSGGTTYLQVGTIQFISVPYALAALNAKHALTADTANFAWKADSANYAKEAGHAKYADSSKFAWEANHAKYSDTAKFAFGAKGEKGDKGDIGLQGIKGDKGDKGDIGANGVNGIQGLKGDKGDMGLQGIQGIKGDKGDIGANGTNGIAGIKGDKGDIGLQGIQGIKGDKGDIGANGTNGIAGIKGDIGEMGLQGIQGIKGDKGDTGANGTNGTAGIKGDKGDIGLQGIQGIKGDKGDIGDISKTKLLELFDVKIVNPQKGTMLYWEGGEWKAIPPGQNRQTLNMCDGIPIWGPCPSSLPIVTTQSVSSITYNSVSTGGNVVNDGGDAVISKGICYSTSSNPTILNNISVGGTGTGIYTNTLQGLLPNTNYYIRAFATNINGTAYGNEIIFKTSPLPVLDLGTNFEGGIIAYIFQPGDLGYIAGEVHGLIAAPTDQSTGIRWYNGTDLNTGASGTAIGTGNINTTKIVIAQGAGSYAAQICYDLVLGGFSDWYLPSSKELEKLYLNKAVIGNFSTVANNQPYWSSSEDFFSSNGWVYWTQFVNGVTFSSALYKFNLLNVRAVRTF